MSRLIKISARVAAGEEAPPINFDAVKDVVQPIKRELDKLVGLAQRGNLPQVIKKMTDVMKSLEDLMGVVTQGHDEVEGSSEKVVSNFEKVQQGLKSVKTRIKKPPT